MSVSSTNRVLDFIKERKRKVDFLLREKERRQAAGRNATRRFFALKASGNWIEKACARCSGGMSKYLVERQIECGRDRKNLICSKCARREDRKALKEL